MRRQVKFIMAVVVLGAFLINEAYAQPAIWGGAVILGRRQNGDTHVSGGSVIYAAPNLHEKVKDYRDIRFSSTGIVCSNVGKSQGRSLGEILDEHIKKWREFDILEVVRVFYGSSPDCATFWISYLPK